MQQVISKYHDQPLYILPGKGDQVIHPAPFIKHTDAELALIEELVGRTPSFIISIDLTNRLANGLINPCQVCYL